LIDEFLAKSKTGRCSSFRETSEVQPPTPPASSAGSTAAHACVAGSAAPLPRCPAPESRLVTALQQAAARQQGRRPHTNNTAPAPTCTPAARVPPQVIAKQAFPMFLNVAANVTNWNTEGTECSLVGGGCPAAGCHVLGAEPVSLPRRCRPRGVNHRLHRNLPPIHAATGCGKPCWRAPRNGHSTPAAPPPPPSLWFSGRC
jgi:hypothetical protein